MANFKNTGQQYRWRRSLATLCALAGSVGYTLPSHAQCGTSNVNHGNTNGLKEYRVNTASFDDISGVSRDQGLAAVVRGADIWNEQGKAGRFRLGASTTLTSLDMPSDIAACNNAGIDFSLVVVKDGSLGTATRAATRGACVDATGEATQFVITIYTNRDSTTPWDWATVNVGPTQYDLTQTLVHEFGHTQRLGHTSNVRASVMDRSIPGIAVGRELFPDDQRCLDEVSGRRSMRAYRGFHSGNTISSDGGTTSGHSSVGAGVSWVDGIQRWTSASTLDACVAWNDSSWASYSCGTAERSFPLNLSSGIAPVIGVWREDESYTRIFQNSSRTATGRTQGVRTRYFNPSDPSHFDRQLLVCNSMTGFMQCGGNAPMYSGRKMSVAWDAHNDRSTMAWVHQNRLGNSDSREVLISTGYITDSMLPQPNSLGVRSGIAPALVCSPGAADGHDCMVAYTDENVGSAELRVRRFSAVTGSTHYSLDIDPTPTVVNPQLRTGSNVAVWHSGGEFWLLVRPVRAEQRLEAYSSPDTKTWTYRQTVGLSDVGPSVASYVEGTNFIHYAR